MLKRSRKKSVRPEVRAREWNSRTVFLYIFLIFLLMVPGRHFTLLDSILTQHEPFRTEYNGPLTQPGLVHISDNVTQIIPGKLFTQKELKEGRIPLWNPEIFCGMPHMADLHSQVFSITDTPFLMLMDVDDALGAAALLKVLLAGYFMFLLCRHLWLDIRLSLAAGTLYALSSFSLGWLYFPSFLSTTLYYPLGLLLWDKFLTQVDVRTKRHSQLWLGLVMGLMILGGQLQLFANFIILLVLYGLFSGRGLYTGNRFSRLRGLVIPLFFAFMAGMVQLLPTFELMIHSTRTAGGFNLFSDIQAMVSKQALFLSVIGNIIQKILTLGFPFGWSNVIRADAQPFPEAVIYVGVTALICLLAPRKIHRGPFDRFLYRLSIAAIGVNLFSLFLNSIFSFAGVLEFLNPGRCAISIAVLTIPLLAVWRIDAFRKGDKRLDEIINIKALIYMLGAFVVVCLAVGVVMVIRVFSGGMSSITTITAAFFYFGEFIVLLLLYRHLRRAGTFTGRDATIEIFSAAMIAEALLLAAVIALPGARLTTKEVQYNSLTQLFAYEEEPFRIARYKSLEEDDFAAINKVVKSRSPVLKPNEGMIIGIDDFQGYNSLNPREFSDYVKSIDERLFTNLRGSIDLFEPEQVESPLLDIANVRYILSLEEISSPGLNKLADSPVKVYRRKGVYPRVFLEGAGSDRYPVSVVEYRPGFLEAQIESTSGGLVVFSENLFPGWGALVDGERASIDNYGDTPFMSVGVPGGKHMVQFIYQPASFYLGIILSLTGFGLAALLLLLLSKRVSVSRTRESSRDDGTS